MLVGNSVTEYVFIRLIILAVRSIAPLSILYTLIIVLSNFKTPLTDDIYENRLPRALEAYLFAEAAFVFAVYLPLKTHFQAATSHPKPPSKAERRELWRKVLTSVTNTELYLPGWFYGANIGEIGRGEAADFISWSLLSKHVRELDKDEIQEVDGYLDDLVRKIGQPFAGVKAESKSLRTTFDDVPMQHRPLQWYIIVFFMDLLTHIRLWMNSLTFYRSSITTTLSSFPPRPLALLGHSQPSPPQLSYWFKAHKSKTSPPILFIHGIGIGLYAYVDFITQLVSREHNSDGDVGIIVPELLPISSRICAPALTTEETKKQIQHILGFHGWKEFTLIGHSYGTAIASTILRDKRLSKRVRAAMLLDPICFLLHLPDVAFNFTRRKPRRANEHMLHYFSSQDMLISHTLARRFFWAEYILWKEDLDPDMPLTVVLSAKDLIVPTAEVWTYLTGTSVVNTASQDTGSLHGAVDWKEDKLEVLWFGDFDHAGMFASKGARHGIASHARRLTDVADQ